MSKIIELNVGGVIYATTASTLGSYPDSMLGFMLKQESSTVSESEVGEMATIRDNKGRLFIDRDGVLFRFILDFARNKKLILPEHFHERHRLKQEAAYYKLPELEACLEATVPPCLAPHTQLLQDDQYCTTAELSPLALQPSRPCSESSGDRGYITVGYRGTFAFGRGDCGGAADVKFRKLWRILVSGKVSLCREVFRDTLNESRDADRGTSDRYSARFFLKHSFLEQAFDALQECGFKMVGAAGSGTNSAGDLKPGMDGEENKWNHYNEFIFCR